MPIRLDPGAARIVAMARASTAPPPEASTPGEARASFRASRAALAPALPVVAEVREFMVPGPGGYIGCRLYRGFGTSQEALLPVFLFFHSGGWVSGDLETHDSPCRAIASVARCAVIAVDYRRAPEHPFPSAIEDAQAVFDHVIASGPSLGLDETRVAVGGDSAGANIAAVLALLIRDRGGPQPLAQILLYPATDFTADTPSLREFGAGPALTRSSLSWFAQQYLPTASDASDWRASPLLAPDHSGLPPTFLATCGFDPLRDEGEAYGDRLEAAGVAVHRRPFPGQIHGFLTMGGFIPATTILIGEVASALDRAFCDHGDG